MIPLLLMLLTSLVILGLVMLKEFVNLMEYGLALYQIAIVSACKILCIVNVLRMLNKNT